MLEILSLQETVANYWVAKYQGNYGIYTIKITFKGSELDTFHCTCPSDYYPCKHIGYVEEAILERKKASNRSASRNSLQVVTVADILARIGEEDLRRFLVAEAGENTQLASKIKLTFAGRLTPPEPLETASLSRSIYNGIIAEGLLALPFDDEDEEEHWYEYDDSRYELPVIDEWTAKAEEHFSNGRLREAFAIAKACIEELGVYFKEEVDDADAANNCFEYYQEAPFQILHKIARADRELAATIFDFCFSEHDKEKYDGIDMYDYFLDTLSITADTPLQYARFVALQTTLIRYITEKNSKGYATAVKRLKKFYQTRDEMERAFAIAEENLQVPGFREEVVNNRIENNQLADAKKLIQDIVPPPFGANVHGQGTTFWYELLLKIALLENDVPAQRSIAFQLIEARFHADHYRAYKRTFTAEEWEKALQDLTEGYRKGNKCFQPNVADLLAEEADAQALLDYLAAHPSFERLKQYHVHVISQFPEQTFLLLGKSIVDHLAVNINRGTYEQVARFLATLKSNPSVSGLLAKVIVNLKLTYKNRRALWEELSKI